MLKKTFFCILMFGIFVSGCEVGSKIPFLKKEEDWLVNLKFETKFMIYSMMPSEEFDEKIKKPIEAKYPKLQLVQVARPYWWTAKNGYSEAADLVIHHDVFPVMSWNGEGEGKHYPMLDLRELMKKNNVNETDFDPMLMDYIKSYGPNGEIFALPMSRKLNALYYNKDIFDQLGVPYPSNGMTWDEVMDMANELTREVDGVKYRGLEPVVLSTLTNQLGLQYVDPKDERVTILDPEWRPVWDLWKQMHELARIQYIFESSPPVTSPGKSYMDAIMEQNWWAAYQRDIGGVNYSRSYGGGYIDLVEYKPGYFREYNTSKLKFITDNNFAMTTQFDLDTLALARKNGHNFDLVALPTFEQAKLKEPANVLGDMIIVYGIQKGPPEWPPTPLLQEIGFRIAMELLSSEAQEERYYDGVFTSLKEPRFTNTFASNKEELAGLQLSAYQFNELPQQFPKQRSKKDQISYGVVVRRMISNYTYLMDPNKKDFDEVLANVADEMTRLARKELLNRGSKGEVK